MLIELIQIKNLTNEIEFHLETKTPFTLGILNRIGKLESYIERIKDVWSNKPAKALADEIKSKLANISPLYMFLFYCKDNVAVNNVSNYLKIRKELLECVNELFDVSELEIVLPSDLDTVEAKELFKKAIEAGLMEKSEKGFKWKESNALLAYFCGKIYCGDILEIDEVTKEEKVKRGSSFFPDKPLQELFNVKNLGQSRLQLDNPPRKKEKIDILF